MVASHQGPLKDLHIVWECQENVNLLMFRTNTSADVEKRLVPKQVLYKTG